MLVLLLPDILLTKNKVKINILQWLCYERKLENRKQGSSLSNTSWHYTYEFMIRVNDTCSYAIVMRWDDPLIDPYEVERLWTDVICCDDE